MFGSVRDRSLIRRELSLIFQVIPFKCTVFMFSAFPLGFVPH